MTTDTDKWMLPTTSERITIRRGDAPMATRARTIDLEALTESTGLLAHEAATRWVDADECGRTCLAMMCDLKRVEATNE